MSQVRTQHPNAPLTPAGRRKMVACVIDQGWSVEATAQRFQVDAKTVRKWRDRYLQEGETGLLDRSSRPRRSPNETPISCQRRILELRTQHRWGAAHIGHEVGRAASTVQRILNAHGVGRLDTGDRASARPIIRYQRDRPGELIHVDVKKIAGIPDGGGWHTHGRGQAPTKKRNNTGYRYIHSALDDRTRIVYSEILTDERAGTAVAFWHRAINYFHNLGITIERVITDNGACYRSRYWHNYNQLTGITIKRPAPTGPKPTAKSSATTAPS